MKNSIKQHAPVVLSIGMMVAMLSGHAYSDQPVNPDGRQSTISPAKTNTPPPQSGVKPEDVLWSLAQNCFKKAQYKDAREKFVQFARQFRNDRQFKEALFYQGLCEMKLGQEGKALSLWEQVVKLERLEKTRSAVLLQTLEQLAGYYEGKGQEAEKKKMLSQLLAEFPEDPVTVLLHVQAAEARLKASDYAGALGLYRAVESKLAEDDRKNLELAVTMTTKGGGARELLTAANESLEKDHVDQAIKLYQTLLKQNPDSPLAAEAKTKLGWCLYLQQKYAEAEPLWQDVIKKGTVKDKWVGESRWHMIQLLTGPRDKPDKAVKLCDVQAIEFAGAFRGQQAVFIKAWIYWTNKEWTKARQTFSDLVSTYPETAQHKPIQDYIRDCEQGIQDAREGRK